MEIALSELIEMVKGLAPELWAIALKQVEVQKINAILGIVVGILVSIACVYGLKKGIALNKNSKYDDSDDVWGGVLSTISIILGAICIISAIVTVFDLPTYFINPEYAAIYILMKLVK